MAGGGAEPGTERQRATGRVPASGGVGGRGHRLVPHAADVILEAWAGTRTGCLTEAVHALVDAFADAAGANATDEVSVAIDGVSDEDVLVALLEEVLFLLDAYGAVAVAVRLDERADAGLTACFGTARAEEVEVTGAVPKGVSRSGLVFELVDGRWWWCHVLVDV